MRTVKGGPSSSGLPVAHRPQLECVTLTRTSGMASRSPYFGATHDLGRGPQADASTRTRFRGTHDGKAALTLRAVSHEPRYVAGSLGDQRLLRAPRDHARPAYRRSFRSVGLGRRIAVHQPDIEATICRPR